MQVLSSLTALEDALQILLQDREALPVQAVPVADAIGRVSAGLTAPQAFPPRAIALTDGWAVRAVDLVGASSYSPVVLSEPPVRIESGAALPGGCDSVIEAELVDGTGGLFQALGECRPGQNTVQTGEEIEAGAEILKPGQKVGQLHVLVARHLKLATLPVRLPRVCLIDVPSEDGSAFTADYIADLAHNAGAAVTRSHASDRTKDAVTAAITSHSTDLIITVGGTGTGRSDATIKALKDAGDVVCHGLAVQPGRTGAVGRRGETPVICLPGMFGEALALWWALVIPVLDRMTSHSRITETRPLTRKISSSPGMSELALLARDSDAWRPLSVGSLPLHHVMQAAGWSVVPASSEGFAANALCEAYILPHGE